MRRCLLHCCLIICCVASQSAAQPLPFTQPQPVGGFFNSTALCITQDHKGFLWVGTTDGLGRYDGKKVLEFRNIPGDTTSISNNYIRVMHTDSKGNIWVGTKRGLNCFDPGSGQFIRYFQMSEDNFDVENNILSIMEDRHGYIWFGTYNGLFRLNPKTQITDQLLPDVENPNSILDKTIFKVFEDSKGRLWVGSYEGLSVYDNRNDNNFSFQNFQSNDLNKSGLKSSIISSFVEQENGAIWFGSYDGIYRVIEEDSSFSFQEYLPDPSYKKGIASNTIKEIWITGHNKLWLATHNSGLGEVEINPASPDSVKIQLHAPRKNPNEIGLEGSPVHDGLIDQSNNLWVVTTGGVNKLNLSAPKINQIPYIPEDENGLKDHVILSVCKDSHNNLWLGTREGLHFLSAENLSTKVYDFKVFQHDKNNKSSISHNRIFEIYEDRQGLLWLGTFYGLNYLDLNTFTGKAPVFNHLFVEDGLPNNYIYGIEETSKGRYWVSTYGQLSKMNFTHGVDIKPSFKNYDMDDRRPDALVNAMNYQVASDRFGDYWVATYNGLSKIINETGEGVFDNYKMDLNSTGGISDNSIICLFKDSKGRFWIGTRNGLNLVVQDKQIERNSFKTFGIKDGFTNTVIQSIQEDNKGHLWVGTNKGLFQFDPERALTGEKGVLRVLKKEDGLTNSNMIFRSATKDKEGSIYFGTASGLSYFNPNDMSWNSNLPKVVFTKLKVLNKTIVPTEQDQSILKKSITYTDSLLFNHQQNIISLEFAALEFSNPDKNQYASQLVGLNEDWVYSGTQNSVTYTNLKPGNYTLKVKACNNDGIWNETPTRLFIKVLPPPWQTWWAYILYAIGVLSILIFAFRFFAQRRLQKVQEEMRINKARYEEREMLRKKNAADFHDELGHRITKITLFAELAERQSIDDDQLSTFIHKIKNNTRELSDGIKDLIWSLDPSQDTLLQTLARIQDFGDRLFDFSDIKFKTEKLDSQLSKLSLNADKRRQVLLIFKEAMNNCLKYSKAENAILQTHLDGNQLTITFKDDGIGMDLKHQKNGYGLNNMRLRAQQIDSKIEILSEIDHGSIIKLQIKIPHMG